MFGKVVHAGSGLLAIVRVYNVTGGLVQEGTTTANGSFVLTGLPFGVYEVRVTSPGYEPRVISNRTLDAANPVANLGEQTMLSKRVGNYQYSPLFGLLIGQAWVR